MIIAETEILTDQGWLTAHGIIESDPRLFCATTGKFVDGYVAEAIKWDEVWTYTLVPYNNTGKQREWTFKAPRPCAVNLIEGHTFDLRAKDVLRANRFDCGYDASYWGHGFMYRLDILSFNGLDPTKYPHYRNKLEALKTSGQIVTPDGSLPNGKTPSQIGSFIRGYLAADGHKPKLVTSNRELFDFFIENHGFAGVVLTGAERTVRKILKVGKSVSFYDDYEVQYTKGANFAGFRVTDVTGPSLECRSLYKVFLSENTDYVIKGGWTLQGD